jgi:hypothetical protein
MSARRKPNLIGVLVVGIAALALTPLAALGQASGPTVLWTFPQPGQRDVPTNAQLWVIGYAISMPTATLNSEPIALERLSFINSVTRSALPELEPNTEYDLNFEFAGLDPGARERFAINFTTGSGPAALPPAPEVHGSVATPGVPADHECEDIINTQDHFDTGQNALRSFDVEVNANPIGWLVLPQVESGGAFGAAWPLSCDEPTMFVSTGAYCYDLYAIGAGGHVGPGTRHCPAPASDPGRPPCYEILEVLPSGQLGSTRSSCDATPDAGMPVGDRDASVVAPVEDAGSPPTRDDAGVIAPVTDAAAGGSNNRDASAGEPRGNDGGEEPDNTPTAPAVEDDGGCTVKSLTRGSDSSALAYLVSLSVLVLLRRRCRSWTTNYTRFGRAGRYGRASPSATQR